MAVGSRIVCACICEAYSQDSFDLRTPRPFCPVWTSRPATVSLAHPGDTLFPLWNGRKVLEDLRSFGKATSWNSAERMGTHFLRRGAARAFLDAGGRYAQLLRSGQWRSSAFQLYIDLRQEASQAMASMWVEAPESEH